MIRTAGWQTDGWWENNYRSGLAERWSIWNDDRDLCEYFAAHLYDRPGAPLDIVVLGCGTGRMIEELDYQRINWTAIDYSETALLKMRLPNTRINAAARVSVRKHDINERPWPVDKVPVSTVIASEILEHLESPGLAIAEALRISPRLMFTVPFGSALAGPATRWTFTPDDFLGWLNSGYSVTFKQFRNGTVLAGIIEQCKR